jgi:hypothetical protein
VQTWSKYVRDLALVNKNSSLRFAHRKPGSVLNLLALNGKTVNQSVTRIIEPFNDLNELRADGVKYSHIFLLYAASWPSLD